MVINAGSTSIKVKLFRFDNLAAVKEFSIRNIGSGGPKNHKEAFKKVLYAVDHAQNIIAVGHRVVHGGWKFTKPVIVTKKVLKELEKFNKLAPLHNPPNILGIKASNKLIPHIPDVAVFDTAFHASLPPKAYLYALPYRFYEKYHVRRYGFHGISYSYVSEEAARILRKPLNKLNLIICHLGGGSSICAVKNGKSIDTSMGFTPMEGVPMMTRTGDIDPGILLYLIRRLKYPVDRLDHLLNFKSGVYGLSGVSNDMLEVLAEERKGNKQAKLALDVFTYKVCKYIGAYYAILGRVDALIFTAAIGPNRYITGKIVKNCLIKNHCMILYIQTDEEKMIAREVKRVIQKSKVKMQN